MRKFRNLVIGGIETKIFNLILITVLLVAGAFLVVSGHQTRTLSQISEETAARQQESISEITNSVMDQVVQQNMSRITELEAANTDGLLRDLAVRVRMLADYAEKLFADPDSVPRAPYAGPDAAKDGQLSAQVLLAEDADPADPVLTEQLGLIANMSDMMISLCMAYGTDNAYIALPEGAALSVNTVSGSWVGADGRALSFDPRQRFWYRQAAEAGTLIFTDVEADKATGSLCITCAQPVYGPDGELRAVAGADFFLTDMQRAIRDSQTEGGYLAVINQDGHVVLSPMTEGTLQVHQRVEAEDLRQSGTPELAAFVTDALQGKTGVRLVNIDGSTYYMAGVPMETVGWTLVSAFSQELAEQPTAMLRERYGEIQTEAVAAYREKSGRSVQTIIVLLAVITLAVLVSALVLAKRIVKPLNTITRKIANLNAEDREFRMEDAYRTGDEIQVLAESFADISHKTVLYVEEVQRVTAEKERISTEMHMANQIQESMLPSVFPAFPDRPEFDIYATMEPAKEVGGDFYDFFLIDEDHLCLVMADVSGKGVPAALYMMSAKIILQSCAMLGKSAGEILTKTNEALCSNNKMGMFVTTWVGILEISTGRLTAANAGHEYPALLHGKRFELLKDKHGFVIGGLESARYKEYELQLHPGDKLFLYTDGVPEATDKENHPFGSEQMLEALNRDPDAAPEQVLQTVRSALSGFVQDAEQFDDLTMLCLEYKGRAQ